MSCADEPNVTNTRPKTVLVFGVFDLLHPGHIAFLRAAKKFGDRLVAVVTRDDRATAEKGSAPIFNLDERLAMLNALAFVDDAVPGDPAGKWSMVTRLSPDVICLGHDQADDHPNFLAQLEKMERRPRLVRLQAVNRERYSTSRLKKAIFDKISLSVESRQCTYADRLNGQG